MASRMHIYSGMFAFATVLTACFFVMAVPARYMPSHARAGWGKFAPVAVTVGPCDFCNHETGDPCVTHR